MAIQPIERDQKRIIELEQENTELNKRMEEADLRHHEDNEVIGYWTRRTEQSENDLVELGQDYSNLKHALQAMTEAKDKAEADLATLRVQSCD